MTKIHYISFIQYSFAQKKNKQTETRSLIHLLVKILYEHKFLLNYLFVFARTKKNILHSFWFNNNNKKKYIEIQANAAFLFDIEYLCLSLCIETYESIFGVECIKYQIFIEYFVAKNTEEIFYVS